MKVAHLQDRLNRGEPTLILDVRRRDQREEWRIPDSQWVDAYDGLRAGETDMLDALDLPKDVPIVTVCAAGVTAEVATKHLREKGHRAHTLEGGMKAWNLAWDSAETPLAGDTVLVQVRRPGKGCLSHVLVNQGDALVIDPSVGPAAYDAVARRLDARIVGILDTHVHADHLSRAPLIARHLGVPYHIGRTPGLAASHVTVDDGDVIPFGEDQLEVLHTPGHTWEHSTYRRKDVLFTGDTLFVDGVGRPDLGAGKTETSDRTRALHDSLRRILRHDGRTRVLPAHASVPLGFDGVQWAATLDEIRDRVQVLSLDKDAFVAAVEAHLGDVPPAYHRMVRLNLRGSWTNDDAEGLEAGPNRCAGN